MEIKDLIVGKWKDESGNPGGQYTYEYTAITETHIPNKYPPIISSYSLVTESGKMYLRTENEKCEVCAINQSYMLLKTETGYRVLKRID